MTAFELTSAAARRALRRDDARADAEDEAIVERYALIVWSHLTEPGDSAAGRLIREHGAAGALRVAVGEAVAGTALSADELAKGRSRWLPRLSQDAVAASLRVAAANGVQILTPADDHWPGQLDDLEDHAPLCLWVRGDTSIIGRLQPSVAIVGARAATSYGEHVALELSADLAGSGIPVVSGGAYGIDGAAHRAAMTVGGVTVALLAGGADRAYPAGHTQLIGAMAAVGAVVSEVPCGSAPTKWRFLQRNRLIAAISTATVVVEAGWRSGSLNTAAHAAVLARGLGAVPGPITSAASAGTHRLLREFGAQCITSAADIRELLGTADERVGHPQGTGPDTRPHTDETTRVRDALSTRAWRDADDLARRCGMAREDVEAVLGMLLLEGQVVRSGTAWRSSVRR